MTAKSGASGVGAPQVLLFSMLQHQRLLLCALSLMTFGSGVRTNGTEMSGDPSELEWALHVLVKNYDKYASGCCKKPRRISKKDFRKMLSRELNHMLTDTGNKRAADKLICDLDENKDGHISFEEYWTLIGGIASPIACLIRQQEHGTKFTK